MQSSPPPRGSDITSAMRADPAAYVLAASLRRTGSTPQSSAAGALAGSTRLTPVMGVGVLGERGVSLVRVVDLGSAALLVFLGGAGPMCSKAVVLALRVRQGHHAAKVITQRLTDFSNWPVVALRLKLGAVSGRRSKVMGHRDRFLRVMGIAPHTWASRYGLEIFSAPCPKCGRLLSTTVPFACGTLRGLMAPPCKCGCGDVPYEIAEADPRTDLFTGELAQAAKTRAAKQKRHRASSTLLLFGNGGVSSTYQP